MGQKGHPSLFVDETHLRALRNESALAIMHHWGVSTGLVHRWRRAFGVTINRNAGSRRLVRMAACRGAEASRTTPVPPENRERCRRVALENNHSAWLILGYHGPWWAPEQLALLGYHAGRGGSRTDQQERQRGTSAVPGGGPVLVDAGAA